MNRHRSPLFIFLLAGLVLGAGWTIMNDPLRLAFQDESRLWIEGTSSLHTWTCAVEQIDGFVETKATTAAAAVSKVEVNVPVDAISCKNGTMDKKTRQALDAEAHPRIRYVLDHVAPLPASQEGWFRLKTTGRLAIAGTEQPVEMNVQGRALPDGGFRFSGQTPLRMTHFGVKPPTALLGTLKTGDEVVVHFDVTVNR